MKPKKSYRKTAIIRINDIFDEINVENNRLKNELLFANKCINILYKFKYYLNCICDKFGDNLDVKLSQELNKLENDYKEIIDEKQNGNYCKSRVDPKPKEIEKPVIKEEINYFEIHDESNESRMNESNKDENDFEYSSQLYSNNPFIESNDSHLGLNENMIGLRVENSVKVKTKAKSCIVNKYKNMNSTNKNNKYIFKCDWIGCNFITNRNSRLRAHHNYHTGNRPYKCSVFGCDKAFVGRESLTTHIKSVHNSERVIKCDILKCIRRAKIVKKLKPNLKVLSDEKPFVCDFTDCPYKSRTRQALREHRLTHGERTMLCTFTGCTKIFKNKKQLKNHLLTHSVEPPHKCKFIGCDAAFRTYKTLKIHKLV